MKQTEFLTKTGICLFIIISRNNIFNIVNISTYENGHNMYFQWHFQDILYMHFSSSVSKKKSSYCDLWIVVVVMQKL